MVDLSTKKPPFSNEEIGDSLLDYILSEASNEPTENTAEVLTNEMIDRLLLDAILGKVLDSQYENIEEGKNAKNDSAQETQIT